MRFGLPRRNGLEVPEEVSSVLPEATKDILSVACEERTTAYLVATKTHVYAVRSGAVELERPWHMVDTGKWNDESNTLTVQWVDRAPTSVWQIELPSTFPQVFRERVQASVVLSDEVDLGERRTARVVVRKDLATQALLGQTILGRGVRAADPGVREQTTEALDRLREQVGLI